VTDAGDAGEGSMGKFALEVCKFAGGAAAMDLPILQSGDTGGIVAAVFQEFQSLNQPGRRRICAQDANDPAHG
jgi:hypothetical protein